ncbi:hypothetical protein Taro_014350 [Colocasia esculenta]|uniref:DNA-binding protein RHL1 n=1 Tax=Colocasia esculenta TaxID=4460 RepID=A0A843UJ51_COLES|nr:hypothetical protein [Colocasia esculenta]
MVKKVGKGEAETPAANPEAEQRKKLKSLAFSRKLLSHAPVKQLTTLEASKMVVKQQGRDVIKKGQRKNRFLFSFPGLLAPISGGRIGELANLSTGNPVLYLEFPQGRMKLFGTVVYPKNKYLTLQFSRSSKGVLCEDSFESMIVFSEAWWVGRKEDNPEEIQLDFPEECNVGNNEDFDFRGGAGATTGSKSDSNNKQAKEFAEHLSPNTELREDVSDDSDLVREEKVAKMLEETPVRHSSRTAGKSLNYAESSGDDSNGSAADKSEMADEVQTEIGDCALEISHSHEEYEELKMRSTGKVKDHHIGSSDEKSLGKRGSLVQATLSTLFDKVAKKSKSTADGSSALQDSDSKRPKNNSKQPSKAVKGKALENKKTETGGNKPGVGSSAKKRQRQVQNDEDIEDISSESKVSKFS